MTLRTKNVVTIVLVLALSIITFSTLVLADSGLQYLNCGHPELREGEVWVTNSPRMGENVYWKTKRFGRVAYDIYGKAIKGFLPVFALITELEERGVDITRMKEKCRERYERYK